MTTAPTPIRPEVQRLGPGRYDVRSSDGTKSYAVQLDMIDFAGGVCNCQGYEPARRNGNACTHLRRAIAAETEHTKMTEENGTTAVATRGPDTAPVAITAMKPDAISMFPTEPEFAAIAKMATYAVQAGEDFVPRNVKTPAQAIAIMLAGRELGIRPMTALRHVYVVNGKTDLETRALMGVCIARDPSISFETPEYTQEAVTVVMHRPGRLVQPIKVRYTAEDAKKSGQSAQKPNRGPGPWQLYTRDMLFAAAAKRCCRIGAPDLINAIEGAMVTVEDAADMERQASVRVDEPTPAQIAQTDLPADAYNDGDDRTLPAEVQQPTEVDARKKLRTLLEEVKETTDAEFFAQVREQLKTDYPDAHNAAGGFLIAKMTHADVTELCGKLEAKLGRGEPPAKVVQGEMLDERADDEAID